MKALKTLSCIWFLIAISSAAPPPPRRAVLDVNGRPLIRGVPYRVRSGGDRTLNYAPLNIRTSNCPMFVTIYYNNPSDLGVPVFFEPFEDNELAVMEGSDFHIHFNTSKYCLCPQCPSFWNVNVTDPKSGRRLISLEQEDKKRGPNGYFSINKNNGTYNFGWCPLDACPTCKPKCSPLGDLNGNYFDNFLALDGGDVFPVTFERF